MWEFPSIERFINNNGFQIFLTIMFSIASLVCWITVYSSVKQNTKESGNEFLKNILVGSLTSLLAILSFGSLISNYREITECRNLDLNQVKNIRVRKMSGENSFANAKILYSDADKIREGLQSLKNAGSFERRKINNRSEKFVYGYQIQIILENDSLGPTLDYFSENDSSQKNDVVIPQCAVPSSETVSTDNIYTSTTFGSWIRENIEPQFKNAQ